MEQSSSKQEQDLNDLNRQLAENHDQTLHLEMKNKKQDLENDRLKLENNNL